MPKLRAGDAVRTRVCNPAGHTRVPQYARGRVGSILTFRGRAKLPDTIVNEPTTVSISPSEIYAVRFRLTDLWGDGADENAELILELWEEYL